MVLSPLSISNYIGCRKVSLHSTRSRPHVSSFGVAGDGVFYEEQGGNIVLVDLRAGVNRTLVSGKDVVDVSSFIFLAYPHSECVCIMASVQEHGHRLKWYTWQSSPNMDYILFKTDPLKVSRQVILGRVLVLRVKCRQQWRHSSFGNYYIHSLKDVVTSPLVPPSNPPKISYATWSPVGTSVAYVSENDLYVVPDVKYVI